MAMFPRWIPTLLLLLVLSHDPHANGQLPKSPGNDVTSVEVDSRDQLIRAVAAARPGTQILIAPGTYQGGLYFRGITGTSEKRIVIAARDPENPPVFRGGDTGMHLSRCEHLEIRDLVIERAQGNGLNLDDGGDADQPSRNLALRRLKIRDVGPSGNRDGIKLSGVDHFSVDACVVERWGDAGSAIDMVGCHHGQIVNCEFNYQSDLAANGVQTKGGSSDIVIERCRFAHAGSRAVNAGGSTGRDYFRPRAANYEARNITVQDCTLIGSMAPIAFVGVDGATVQHNTIYLPTKWVIRILQESQGAGFVPCRNGIFQNNLVVFRSDQVRNVANIGGGTSPETFRFRGNHWYCIDQPQRSRPTDLPVAETNGSYGGKPAFADESKLDLRILEASNAASVGPRAVESR